MGPHPVVGTLTGWARMGPHPAVGTLTGLARMGPHPVVETLTGWARMVWHMASTKSTHPLSTVVPDRTTKQGEKAAKNR